MNAFIKNPASRTIDAVPDLRVLLAQLVAYKELSEEERKIVIEDP